MEDSFGHRGNEWDEVRTLFGGYLHQDFIDDYGDEWGAVRQYCADATASHITAAADELADVLENFRTRSNWKSWRIDWEAHSIHRELGKHIAGG